MCFTSKIFFRVFGLVLLCVTPVFATNLNSTMQSSFEKLSDAYAKQ